MKIRTVENLYDALSNDLAWRKKELAEIKSMVDSKSNVSSKRESLIRAGVALLYAHWEGYIKTAGNAYLEFVSMQRLRYEELTPNFIALCMKSALNQALETSKIQGQIELVEFFINRLGNQSSVPFKNGINTKSNLSSKVFSNIVLSLGLDYTFFEGKEKLLDDRLLYSRNSIAHGRFLLIDEDDFDSLQQTMLGMMEVFRNQIDNSASLRSFVRT